MKLQFGILYRDERVADRQDLDTLLGDYASYNAETSGEHFDGPLMMAYRGDKITWEEDSETQPYSLGPYTITFDGRLDNREDIAAKVGIVANQSLPDPTLILQVYEKYGDSLLPELIGEFSLVIWKKDNRELTFCRSVDGARPLYYTLDGDRLIWSSDILHLLRVSAIAPYLNERYLSEYLLGNIPSHLSPFSEIFPVRAGTMARYINAGLGTPEQLWNPGAIQPLAYNSDEEYEEHFKCELGRAVASRLRAKGTVFAELSGGLDSSSIVLTADNILRANNVDPRALRTISAVYTESITSDESYFINLIERQLEVPTIRVSEDEQRFTMGFREITLTGIPSIFQLYPGRYARFTEHMREHNARILLTGFGGDHIFCSSPTPEALVADSLYDLDFLGAHRCCKLWATTAGIPYFSLLLLRALPLVFQPLLPSSWQLKPHKRQSWLKITHDHDCYREIIIKGRVRPLPSQVARIAITDGFFRATSSGEWNAACPMYVSHPYSHRPLIELCIAMPMSQMQRDGTTRSLVRRALASLLPTKVVRRKGKALINEPLSRALQKDWVGLGEVRQWQVCRDGYVDAPAFAEFLRLMRAGLPPASGSGIALYVITVERFVRSLRLLQQNVAQQQFMTA